MKRAAKSSIFAGLVLFLLCGTAWADTIYVLIKGIDDGIKSSRDRDYKEALMNAKLQAIERAGAEIASVTRVEDFTLKFDMVESRAKAVLLPGFQVIDMGYQQDGTYQVVLAGKVQVGEAGPQKGKLWGKLRSEPVQFKDFKEAFDYWRGTFPGSVDNEYVNNENGSVTDLKTGLMWLLSYEQAENMEQIREYIKWLNSTGFAGYTDWRLPSLAEISSIVEKKSSATLNSGRGSYLAPIFDARPYCWYLWSADACQDGQLLVYVGEEKSGICIAGDHYQSDGICVACIKAVRSIK